MVKYTKSEKKSSFASLPHEIQEEVKRFLELGDFRSAKLLYDRSNLNLKNKSL